jgi:peptidyl-prolyl cis-trans isomerase A (cyclophilin A)
MLKVTYLARRSSKLQRQELPMGNLFVPPAIEIEGEGDLCVEINTRLGVIKGRLFEKETPKTVANFVGLATGKITGTPFYDGILFHRVIPNFMVQAGCPDGRGTGGPGYCIEDEFDPSLRHDRPGLFSMANRGPNTGGSQFFLTEVATPWLDDKHAIFGEIIEGFDVIKAVTAEPRGGQDRPREDITMESVKVYRA